MKIKIMKSRLAEALQDLRRFEKKALKYKTPTINFEIVDTFTETKTYYSEIYERNIEHEVEYVTLDVEGVIPKVGDYTFVGKVEFQNKEDFLQFPMPNFEDYDFSNVNMECEHCNHNRFRKHIFVLKNNNTGEFIQVGKTCMKDFIGHDDLTLALNKYNFIKMVNENNYSIVGNSFIMFLADYLASVLCAIDTKGWVSKVDAYEMSKVSTADAAFDNIREKKDQKYFDQSLELIEWVKKELKTDSSYTRNLKILFKDNEICSMKHLGIIASAPIAKYNQEKFEKKEQEKNEARKISSDYQFEVKQRFKKLEVVYLQSFDFGINKYDYYGGHIFLHKFKDVNGNIYTWTTANSIQVDQGEKLFIDATVKQHKEYNDEKQTVLTRVKQR